MSIAVNNDSKTKKRDYKFINLKHKIQDIPQENLENFEFSIELGENEIVITATKKEDGYELLINKKDNASNCVKLEYNNTNDELWLDSLLFKISDDDKCRKIEGERPGIYYIDLILNLVKILIYKNTLFKPKWFLLSDGATITSSDLNIDYKDEEIELSIIKLLMEGRTFYEGYGFLPIGLNKNELNYDDFDIYINSRQQILILPILELLKIIQKLDLSSF